MKTIKEIITEQRYSQELWEYANNVTEKQFDSYIFSYEELEQAYKNYYQSSNQ